MSQKEQASRDPKPRAPVFIVGAPRSGTTLLRVTLGRHSQLAMWGVESGFFRRLYSRRSAFGDPADPKARLRIVQAYLATHSIRGLPLDRNALHEALMRDGVSWRDLFAAMLQFGADFQDKPYAGEKTPNHALHVTTLCEWFPNCTIVHLVRDPRAAVCSLMQMPFASRSTLMGARHWNQFNLAARVVSNRENYLLVHYEDLIRNTQEQLRRICGHIGIPYEAVMLHAEPRRSEVHEPLRRAFKPLTNTRLEVWRQELKPWQVAIIEELTGPQMKEFGYARQTPGATFADRGRAVAEATFEMALQKLCRLPCILSDFLQPTNLVRQERWFRRAATLYQRMRLRQVRGS